MATTIKLKSGSGAPLAGDLVAAEPALDLTNKRLYTEDSGGTVIEVGTNPTSLTTGTFTSTGIDDNATSTAITIDSSENIGIGTTSPSGVAGTILELSRSGSTRLNISAGDSSYSAVDFSDTSADGSGRIEYYHLIDTMRFWTNGSEAMRIDSSGDLLLGGTTSYTSFLSSSTGNLQVNGGIIGEPGSGNPFEIANYRSSPIAFSTSGNIERMRIDSSGNVGIGTTSPSRPLSIEGTGTTYMAIVSPAANTAGLLLGDTSSDSQGRIQYNNPNDALQIFTAGSERMRIDSSGNVGIGETSPDSTFHVNSGTGNNTAFFESTDNGAIVSIADNGGSIQLRAIDSGDFVVQVGGDGATTGTNSTEAMRIDANGQLKIGGTTNSPANVRAVLFGTGNASLIYDSGHTGLHINNENATAGIGNYGAGVSFGRFGSNSDDQSAAIVPVQTTADEDHMGIAFLTHDTNTRANPVKEKMRITGAGDVGIGTTNPEFGIHYVSGTSGNTTVLSSGDELALESSGDVGMTFRGGAGNFASMFFAFPSDTYRGYIQYGEADDGLRFGTAKAERMRIDASGNLLVGTTTSGGSGGVTLRNDGVMIAPQVYATVVTAGLRDIQMDSDGYFGYSTSTRETKDNIEPLSDVSWLYSLNPVSFTYKNDQAKEQQYGLIYDEVEPVNPDLCFQNEVEGELVPAGVHYSRLIAPMLKAIQEQQAMIETLKAEVAALKGA